MDAEGNERLVRAYTSADVLRHVTPQFVIAPASHDDIISLMASGVMPWRPWACPKPSRPKKARA
jgi:hypothetical protein